MSKFSDIIDIDNFFKGIKVLFVSAVGVAVLFGIYKICQIGELLNVLKLIGLVLASIIGIILISVAIYIIISCIGWMVNVQIPNLRQKYRDWKVEKEYLPILHQIAEEYDFETYNKITQEKIKRFFVKENRWCAEVTDHNGNNASILYFGCIYCKKKGDTSTTYILLRLSQLFEERRQKYEQEKKENNKGWFKKCLQLSKR